ncbi:hypothetical protein APE_2077.1 [Aeropyrum pernix K1]|uniref:Uncharacterized protein n=1 Tax=Aeropyrum pernix (strain ATCC 700893 / DSM 11879 / JCM 9820 / NBRC 100138 / K1) TaxID=272557 RepID=Q9YA61_AERPE|nr:hypothetical protein [Aeropyrum pernix]BAA81088.2 hypothetical protein APE_2077.1 [Aeropyrum pernix K1]
MVNNLPVETAVATAIPLARGCLGLGRTLKRILWLDGRPSAFRVVKQHRELLARQGVEIEVPKGGPHPSWAGCEVAVLPPPDSPERSWAEGFVAPLRCRRLVSSKDPLRALYTALAYPSPGFLHVTVGIDPGRMCTAVALADGLVLWEWKGGCGELGPAVRGVLSRIPHEGSAVYLGSGPSFEEAEESLAAAGLGYSIVEEWGSTRSPYEPPGGLSGLFSDKDILASITIAYRGLSRWRMRV